MRRKADGKTSHAHGPRKERTPEEVELRRGGLLGYTLWTWTQGFLKQFGKVSKITTTAVKLLELEKLNVTFSFLSLWDRSTISYKIGQ